MTTEEEETNWQAFKKTIVDTIEQMNDTAKEIEPHHNFD